MQLEQHQIDTLNMERDAMHDELLTSAFIKDAVARVRFCLTYGGDLRDLLNTLDLEFDSYECMSDVDINEIVISAVRVMV